MVCEVCTAQFTGTLAEDRRSSGASKAEPDTDIIKAIATTHVPSVYHTDNNRDPQDLEVKFLAEGAAHKVYKISHPGLRDWFVFRVALPVNPRIKTESQAATSVFLTEYTTIPVPQLLAYDSSADNELGYEWLLLNAVNGVSLDTVWKSLTWREKVDITMEIADITHQLENISFDRIAGLYLCETLCNSCQSRLRQAQPIVTEKQVNLLKLKKPSSSSKKSTLYYGPLPRLLSNNMRKPRLHAKGRCGPFRRDYEWLEQKIRWRLDWIDFCLALLEENIDNDEYLQRIGIDRVFKRNSSKYKQEYVDLLKLMPEIFEMDDDQSEHEMESSQELELSSNSSGLSSSHISHAPYHLDHDDLHEKNIIVDPVTHKISGIIDWEVACVLPEWETSNYPLFLEGPTKMATFATAAETSDEHPSYEHNIFETECLKSIYDVTLNLRAGEPHTAVRFTDVNKLKANFDRLITCIPSTNEHRKNLIKCELLKLSSRLGNAEAVKIILDMGILKNGDKVHSRNEPIPVNVNAKQDMKLVELFIHNASLNDVNKLKLPDADIEK